MHEPPHYPGYSTLAKADTPSWNARTRAVIEERLATAARPRFFTADEWTIADALCQTVIPGEVSPPLVALLDAHLLVGGNEGTREEDMPWPREAWRQGLAALDAQAQVSAGCGFVALSTSDREAVVAAMATGRLSWREIDARRFFERRVIVDVPALFYGLPQAWDEIGFGGPASPRGYVRLDGDRRDPWEAAEWRRGDDGAAERENRHVV